MFSGKKLFILIIWLLYCLITFLAVLHHDHCADEANYWLVARDMNLSEIFVFFKFCGHPGLWFFILMPFAKMGLPFFSAGIIHWILIITAAAAFLFKAPFSILFKMLFVFSYYMIFQYVVDIRDYNLTIVLLFLIASIYKKRFEHKLRFSFLIFFLFNSNVHSFGAATALMIIYILETYQEGKLKQRLLPVTIMVAGCAALIFQLYPTADLPVNVTVDRHLFPALNINSAWVILTGIQNAFIPVAPQYEELKIALLFFLFFLFIILTLSNKKSVFIFLFIASAWLFYLFSAVQSGGLRHEGLLLIFIIFSLWIQSLYPIGENSFSKTISRFINFSFAEYAIKIFIGACLLISVAFSCRTLQKEFSHPVSLTLETGAFIAKNISDNSEIACYKSYLSTAVAPYIPKIKLWFVDRKEYGTYFLLDSIYGKYGDTLSEQEVLNRCKEKYDGEKSIFLLLSFPLTNESLKKYSAQLLFQNKNPAWTDTKKRFWLYRITFPND